MAARNEVLNDQLKPLIWTATADHILEKVARGRVARQTVNQNPDTPLGR